MQSTAIIVNTSERKHKKIHSTLDNSTLIGDKRIIKNKNEIYLRQSGF